MKKIFSTLLLIILCSWTSLAFASKLPDKELGILKSQISDFNVRFDGMVELKDGTDYIPVFPLQTDEVQKNVAIKMTIPANKTFKDKPDFIMFNTNFALFKIIPDKGKKTILYNKNIPEEVKTGLFPQDLLVPTGFQIPEPYRLIIGDLVIPVVASEDYKEIVVSTGKVVEQSPRTKIIEKAAHQLSGKYFYTTSFNRNAMGIINSDNGKLFKQVEFSSIPSDIKLTGDGKYVLVSTLRNGNIFVIDAKKATVLKTLQAGDKPMNIAVSNIDKLAYIANRGEKTISIIDIPSMQLKDPIQLKGNPAYIELSSNGNELYYLDAIAGKVYHMQKQESYFHPYSEVPLFQANNLSKIQLSNNKIYALNRGKNELIMYYINGKNPQEGIVNVSDITPIEPVGETKSNIKDYEEYNVNEDVLQDKPKLTFKQQCRKAWRALLYYKEDDIIPETPLNPANQTRVLKVAQSDQVDVVAPVNLAPKKKTAKEKFHDFLHYKEDVKKPSEIEIIKSKVENQMDFITPEFRANDFLVLNDKVYFLCSDDYVVLVYNAKTREPISFFELDRTGYYNSIKLSNDKKIGIITNISHKALTIFDTETDRIIQMLPISSNAHNVTITGRR